MVFDGENYRTAKLKEVVSLIRKPGVNFRQKKLEKMRQKSDFPECWPNWVFIRKFYKEFEAG